MGMGSELSLWRLVIWVAAISGGLTFILSLFVRDTRPATVAEDNPSGAQSSTTQSIGKMIRITMHESKFWRLLALCTVFVGVRLIFVHLNATFPKFFTREMGSDSPFELVIAVNPALVMVCVPFFTTLIEHLRLGSYFVLLLGATLTALSPLPLAFYENSYAAAIMFVSILSVGEALWSPKLYEHTVAVSPVGREGTYGALAVAPIFASMFFAGGFSGHMLEEHCPHAGYCDGYTIWMMVFFTTITSPVILLLCRSCLFHDSDWVQESEIVLAQQGQSYGTADRPSEQVARA